VLIGSYFKGNLFVYDVARERVIGRLFLGRRLRWVQVDGENHKWYATSAVGGLQIDPDVAFPNAGPRNLKPELPLGAFAPVGSEQAE
jgi:hypothetical protein